MEEHRDYRAIIVTHSHLHLDGSRTKPGDAHNPKNYYGSRKGNDGQDLWEKCLKYHSNVFSIYSGHHIPDPISYRFDFGQEKNLVFQSFQNWQCFEDGGTGRIRIITFSPSERKGKLSVFNPDTLGFEKRREYETEHPYGNGKEDSQWLFQQYP